MWCKMHKKCTGSMPLLIKCQQIKNSKKIVILYTYLNVEISTDLGFFLPFFSTGSKVREETCSSGGRSRWRNGGSHFMIESVWKHYTFRRITSSVVEDDTLFRYSSLYVKNHTRADLTWVFCCDFPIKLKK